MEAHKTKPRKVCASSRFRFKHDTDHAKQQLTWVVQACDLCYRKRIKCDGKTPRCSQCQIYDCQCTHQAVSRRKKPSKCRLTQPSDPAAIISKSDPSQIPHQNESVLSSGSKDLAFHEVSKRAHHQLQELPAEDVLQLPTFINSPVLDELLSTSYDLSWDAEPESTDLMPTAQMPLPVESVVRPLIDSYLANFNSLLPLFEPHQLTKTVDQWYSNPNQRTRTSWAVINVVMAISQYCTAGQSGHRSADFSVNSSISDCLSKAQSALTELLTGDVELANLQVVLGLVIVFHATSDIKPAVFLISTALRLCQVLGLHRSDSSIYRNANHKELLQYTRVFWVTFILDRDIALRIRQAPIQQDADISIELPPIEPDPDAAGFFSTFETQQKGFNVFRARVELAQIQGYVYDALFSVRAQRLSPGEKAVNSQAIRLMLKDWKDRIPATLTAKSLALTKDLLPCVTSLLCMLHGTVVTCLGLLCQVNSMDFLWIDQLRDYGRSITSGIGGPCVPPPQPQGWNALVNECREFMPLFNSVQDKGAAFIW